MGRLLLFLALPLSLVVPVGLVTYTVVSAAPDQASIQLPVAPSATPEGATGATASVSIKPKTETFKLFDGATVHIAPGCLDGRGTDEKKQHAISAANQLPPLKQKALDADRDLTVQERKYKTFLNQHPEKLLSTDAYAMYRSLKGSYSQLLASYRFAVKQYNQQEDTFNRLADLYNADLEACKLG